MMAAIRRALSQLGDASDRIATYVQSQLTVDGGVRDRAGRTDLYYTVFGFELLAALDRPVPHAATAYLRGFGLGETLDLVHLSCLIRARASVDIAASEADLDALKARLEHHRTPDGGYDGIPRSSSASAYGCFLVAAAYEDLGCAVPETPRLVDCLGRLRATDGGYGNFPRQTSGLTPTTAAAVTLLRTLGEPVPEGVDTWLLAQRHPESGFFAVPEAPIPDLLSTATALHALAGMNVRFDSLREPCLAFVHSLWTDEGAFAGSWADPTPDCEYTFYGLLALGHLAS
jgi:prenyltransferase beta subunit